MPNIAADELRMERFNLIYEALQSMLTEKYMPSYPVVLHIYGQVSDLSMFKSKDSNDKILNVDLCQLLQYH